MDNELNEQPQGRLVGGYKVEAAIPNKGVIESFEYEYKGRVRAGAQLVSEDNPGTIKISVGGDITRSQAVAAIKAAIGIGCAALVGCALWVMR